MVGREGGADMILDKESKISIRFSALKDAYIDFILEALKLFS